MPEYAKKERAAQSSSKNSSIGNRPAKSAPTHPFSGFVSEAGKDLASFRELSDQHAISLEGMHLGHDFSKIRVMDASRKTMLPAIVPPIWPVQAKLAINQPGDKYEQEADRIAEQVMTPPVHNAVSGTPPRIQRFVGQSSGQMDAVPTSVDSVLASPGRLLEPELQQDMGQRFGHDFSQVRVHSDADAEQSAKEVNAHAYTVGHNIVFGAGRFAPETHAGRQLMAHELTHVVQQSGSYGINSRLSVIANMVPETIHSVQRSQERILQREKTSAPTAQAIGEAVRTEVDVLLKMFASASGNEAKNTAAMQAVRAIIRAYNLSMTGLSSMRFEPKLTDCSAHTIWGEDGQNSRIEFGPFSFDKGFEYLVHVVAHEIEHVRQNLIGGYRRDLPPGTKEDPVQEFIAYSAMVSQVGNTPGPSGMGLLGALGTRAFSRVIALPPLPPMLLADNAKTALSHWKKMSREEHLKYRPEFEDARDRLLERLNEKEAQQVINLPDSPPGAPLSLEWGAWIEASKSPWVQVKEVWKQFDALSKV